MAPTTTPTASTNPQGGDESHRPIELSQLAASQQGQSLTSQANVTDETTTQSVEKPLEIPHQNHDQSTSIADSTTDPRQNSSTSAPSVPSIASEPQSMSHSPLIREATGPASGPATDHPPPVPKGPEIEGPVLQITLLLTTGGRHPFRLDQKYLKKRGVEVEADNPVNMSLYKLKELILRDWRDEWEAKPSSPDSIRLISMGKLLTDKSKLSDFGFKAGATPAIVHMTIKPQDIIDEEEANKNPRDREGSERSPRCRCAIM